MSTANLRYSNYLNGYKFYPNSISFRIISSKSLEKWKNVQSFQLNQLVNGKFFFPIDRREILLLNYDMWSRWLYEVENLCIEIGEIEKEQLTKQYHIDNILSLADKTIDVYKHIMLSKHSDQFDSNFVKIWIEIHEIPIFYMKKRLSNLLNMKFEMMFSKIVDILCEVMQYTLIEIYELDNFYCIFNRDCASCRHHLERHKEKITGETNKHLPFIIVSEMAKKCKDSNISIICERLSIYKKYFNFDEIYIKNYTEQQIPSNIIEEFEKIGIKIDFRKSMIAHS